MKVRGGLAIYHSSLYAGIGTSNKTMVFGGRDGTQEDKIYGGSGCSSLSRGSYNLFQNTEQEVFTSPQGTNTIIVQYDFVSRPTIYKKTWLGKRKIWAYPGSGFMETVHFGVEWLSEDEIKVNYDDLDDEYDEEFIVAIP